MLGMGKKKGTYEDELRTENIKMMAEQDALKSAQDEANFARYSTRDEFQIGEKLITVSNDAKMSKEVIPVARVDKNGNIVEWSAQKLDSGYAELNTDDLASGFFDHNDLTVLRSIASLCASIKAFGESYRIPVYGDDGNIKGYKPLDMRPAHNLFAGIHNHMVISSKGLDGRGAAMSRSHILTTRTTGQFWHDDGERKKFPLKLKGT